MLIKKEPKAKPYTTDDVTAKYTVKQSAVLHYSDATIGHSTYITNEYRFLPWQPPGQFEMIKFRKFFGVS